MANGHDLSRLAEAIENLSAEIRSRHHQVTKHDLERLEKKVMAALDDLTASIAALNTTTSSLVVAVDAAVTDIQQLGPNDAQLQALQQSVDAVSATLKSQTDRLNSAVNGPTPPTNS